MKTPTPPAHARLAALVDASAALAALPESAGPAAVLEALYEQVAVLLGVRDFVVSLYDRDADLIRCGYAVVDGAIWPVEELPALPLGSGPTSQVLRSGRPVIVPDVLAERERWNYRAVGGGPMVRSMVLAPMTRGGEVVGAVQAQSHRLDAFTPNDAAALSVLANQAAAALEAVRRRDAVDRAGARARLLDHTSRLLGQSLDLDDVLDVLTEQVTSVMGAACAVYLLTESGDGYESHRIRHRDPILQQPAERLLHQRPRPLHQSFIGRIILRGRPMMAPDLRRAGLPPELDQAMAQLGINQSLIAPLVRGDRILGALLVVGTGSYPLHADDLEMASAVADRAAAAIEHARLHAEASEHRRFLAQLIEAAPISIAVVRGEELTYELANAAYRTRVGGADIRGRTYYEVNSEVGERFAEVAVRTVQQVRESGAPVRLTDVELGPPGGQPLHIAVDLSPLPADRTRPAGVLMLTWDTTASVLARERLEELARQSAAHAAEMDAIIAGMAEGVMVTDTDGRVRLLNAAGRRILGDALPDEPFDPTDLMDRLDIRDLDGHPADTIDSRALWQTDRPRLGIEFLVRRGGGVDQVLRMSVAPLPGPNGERAGAVAIFEDVTERRALEQAREIFLAQASHELRTPLTSMLGYLQMAGRRLAREQGAPVAVHEAVERAAAQAQRLRELVNDLLDTTRVRQGRMHLRREHVDLRDLVGAALAELRRSSPRDVHTFHLEAPSEPVLGVWDPERLRQVFVNLIDNAVKYSPRGGNIWITVRASGRNAVVSVRDEGVGIPSGELAKLFRPFGRAEHAPARNIPGFGLGLYICRDIVEQHGGRIRVTSRPNQGSTFTVTLPLDLPDDEEQGDLSAIPVPSAAEEQIRRVRPAAEAPPAT